MTDDENKQIEESRPKTDYVWLGCATLITAVSGLLRFLWLDLKPFHHDEGVNGFFLKTLFNDGVYKYDPANYHGPTLYYISLAFAKLFGLETISVRASVAIFGVLTVVLALFLKRYIGRIGSLFAALFLALSPGMVFISRYFIHEMFFVFLSLALVVSVLFSMEKRRAGPFAAVWLVILILTCFLPSALNLAAVLGGTSAGAVWAFRLAFFVIEGVLAYLVVRMLLGWNDGRPIYLLLASASAALLFATKETAFITLGTMLIACGCVWIWRSIRNGDFFEKHWVGVVAVTHAGLVVAALYYRETVIDAGKWLSTHFMTNANRPPENFVFYSIVFMAVAAITAWVMFLVEAKRMSDSTWLEPVEINWNNFRRHLGEKTDLVLIVSAAVSAFAFVIIVFFTSFFTYGEGVSKAFEAYAIWTKTGNKDHTQNGLFGYLKWGMKVESPILILSGLALLISLFKARHRFAMFTGLWAFGLFAAYSIIPYKTPWLALSFLLPMCVIAGYGINELFASQNIRLKIAAAALAISATGVLGYQTYQLNFVRYDDEDMGYVYAHTKRQFLDMMRKIEQTAEKSGKGTDATIEIVSPDYWPMTWYVNNYGHANFHGSLVNANTAEMIVAKKKDQDSAVIARYSTHYKFAGMYPLRPGVDLVLLVRKDLADPDAQELYKILETKSSP